MTAAEIRARIIEVTMENGGHLASSLGAVELAMALRESFDPVKDRIIWDVGHQAYAWKILTGRDQQFNSLRKLGGVAPFPTPLESDCDAMVSGHAGSALSTAIGLAAARDMKGTNEHVVAVVGDASMANGVSFEALNNASSVKKLIVILNDNKMSISRPTGSLARILGRLITGVRYNRVKAAAEQAGHTMKLTFLRNVYHKIESRIKSLFLENAYFEQFGLRYIGPVDGHDIEALKSALTVAKEDKRPVIIHVVTQKGKGLEAAEENPTKWHGISGRGEVKSRGWSAAFGDKLRAMAREDKRIVAITAGMKDGTGLGGFAEEFPDRFFDVGIAEEHAMAFAAGLAAGGMRPFVAIYSTFLQRAVDQLMHDVCIARLPVVVCVDRAGVVGCDGMTHQGMYDVAMTKCLPNLAIVQGCDEAELGELMEEAASRQGPTLIRYPRGGVPEKVEEFAKPEKTDFAIFATGDWYGKAVEVAKMLGNAEVVRVRHLKPFDTDEVTSRRKAGAKIVSIENASVFGGIGETIGADFKFGWPDEFIPHGKVEELEKKFGLDAQTIAMRLRNG